MTKTQYRYFVQQQENGITKTPYSFELLIRESSDERHWTLPRDFNVIPLADLGDLIQYTITHLPAKVGLAAVNLNRRQFMDPDILALLVHIQTAVTPIQLIAEITEETVAYDYLGLAGTQAGGAIERFKQQLLAYNQARIQLSLDDVGCGTNTYDNVADLLPQVQELKFAMQNFRATGRGNEVKAQLRFWKGVADTQRLRLVVEGIETPTDVMMLNTVGLKFQQGFYYGQPIGV